VPERPHLGEQLFLDCGRSSTQLMRDSLGAGSIMNRRNPAFLTAWITFLVACVHQPQRALLEPNPVWRCYTLAADSNPDDFIPSIIVLGTNADSAGRLAATVKFPSGPASQLQSHWAQWIRDSGDSIRIFWPGRWHQLPLIGVLKGVLTPDSLFGQATITSDMGPMRSWIAVHGKSSCTAGA
jgi:hypothetical protein